MEKNRETKGLSNEQLHTSKFIIREKDEPVVAEEIDEEPIAEIEQPLVVEKPIETPTVKKKKLLGLISLPNKNVEKLIKPKHSKISHPVRNRLIYLGIIAILLALCIFLNNNLAISEFMTRTVGRGWIYFISCLTDLIPISVFELLVGIFILVIIYGLIKIIICFTKKRITHVLKIVSNFGLFCLTVAFLYVACTSFSYQRQPVEIVQYQQSLTGNDVSTITNYYIAKLNSLSAEIDRDQDGNVNMAHYYTFRELSKQMVKEYERLDSSYFSSKTPLAKPLITKHLFAEMQTTGITFSLTGEANVNPMIPDVDIPYTMAHELAHTKGVMREDDANLVALYICVTSEDPFIQYSGLFWAISRLLTATYYTNETSVYENAVRSVDAKVLKERQNYSDFWEKYHLLDKIQDWWNDLYLKINGVKDGTASYIDSEQTTDTGETRNDGSKIFEIEFSPMQKMLFALYYSNQE